MSLYSDPSCKVQTAYAQTGAYQRFSTDGSRVYTKPRATETSGGEEPGM